MSRRCRSTGMREGCSPGSTTQRHSATASTRCSLMSPPTISPKGLSAASQGNASRPPTAASSCRARSLAGRVASSHVPGTAHRSPSGTAVRLVQALASAALERRRTARACVRRIGGAADDRSRLQCLGHAAAQRLATAYWRVHETHRVLLGLCSPMSAGRLPRRTAPSKGHLPFSCPFALSERVRKIADLQVIPDGGTRTRTGDTTIFRLGV
jgi:hypothetical protein